MNNNKTTERFRKHVMTMRKPASKWQDAMPSGNGTLGAMVYGSIQEETILLNHEALWTGAETKDPPNISIHLPQLRKLLDEGNYQEANRFFPEKLREAGYITHNGTFQPGFDLKIFADTNGAFRDYERALDFETGEISVAWTADNIAYRRLLFTSRLDEVVVMTYRSSRAGSITASLQLQPHDLRDALHQNGRPMELCIAFEQDADEQYLSCAAVRTKDGSEFGAVARVVSHGGTRHVQDSMIHIKDADEIIVLIGIYSEGESAKKISRIKEELSSIPIDYDRLLEGHAAEHRELFLRSELDLEADGRELVNEQLLLDAYCGDVPNAFMEKMFDYGRYLLISSSRPGGLPANLQGVWNGDYEPPWSSAFFNNENIQMNYWQALQGNAVETLLPFFDFFEKLLPDMRKNAQAFYGCKGILSPLFASPDSGLKKNLQPHVVYWTAGAGWLAQYFYDYYLFTGDTEFLEKRAVPFLMECALFYADFFVEGEDGFYVSYPSNSPENCSDGDFEGALNVAVCINATMDFAVAKEVLLNLSTACRVLNIHHDEWEKWEQMLAKIPQYQINEDGAIQEWMHPAFKDNYHHRHQSHIYPLFPGFEITEDTDSELFEACRIAVEKRLVIGLKEQTGWSLSHMANIYARLGDGDRALECLDISTRSCVGDNLFTYHNDWRNQGITLKLIWGKSAPFQIDANMGWSAAMLEMLVFSKPGLIKLLPALPSAWKKGKCRGVLCRGGVECSLVWDMDAGVMTVRLLSQTKQTVSLKFPLPIVEMETTGDISYSALGAAYKEIHLVEGEAVSIYASLRS